MEDKDLFFSSEDLGEIFGTKAAKAEKPVEKAAPIAEVKAPAPAPVKIEELKKSAVAEKAVPDVYKSSLVTQSKADEFKIVEKLAATKAALTPAPAQEKSAAEGDVDDLIKRAKEIEADIKAASPAPAQVSSPATVESMAAELPRMVPGTIEEKTSAEIVALFEELRKTLFSELALKLPEKSVLNMMTKTLEKSALNFLVLRNTNWDRAGNLIQDGSIDMERFLINIAKYREQLPEMEREVQMALSSLLHLRLRSIKLGLGAPAYNEIKEKLSRKVHVVGAGYGKEALKVIKDGVLPEAFKKGDEEK
jgi:hypothetical protein